MISSPYRGIPASSRKARRTLATVAVMRTSSMSVLYIGPTLRSTGSSLDRNSVANGPVRGPSADVRGPVGWVGARGLTGSLPGRWMPVAVCVWCARPGWGWCWWNAVPSLVRVGWPAVISPRVVAMARRLRVMTGAGWPARPGAPSTALLSAEQGGVTARHGVGGTAASGVLPLPRNVVALIRREAHMFDAMGTPIARPPVDIRNRLLFFHRCNVSLDQINEVVRGRGACGARSWPV
jgi:hypothetical protein